MQNENHKIEISVKTLRQLSHMAERYLSQDGNIIFPAWLDAYHEAIGILNDNTMISVNGGIPITDKEFKENLGKSIDKVLSNKSCQ